MVGRLLREEELHQAAVTLWEKEGSVSAGFLGAVRFMGSSERGLMLFSASSRSFMKEKICIFS